VKAFADSSALVKLYSDEPGFVAVRQLHALVVSELALVEVASALWRKQRTGRLSTKDTAILMADFEADWYGVAGAPARFVVARTSTEILGAAARFVSVHALRAYDAVQLATAVAVRRAEPGCSTFAAFDGRLCQAAALEGFSLIA
jgi:predicted nucleic acid-binding protein